MYGSGIEIIGNIEQEMAAGSQEKGYLCLLGIFDNFEAVLLSM